jgi:hypothetical protein
MLIYERMPVQACAVATLCQNSGDEGKELDPLSGERNGS